MARRKPTPRELENLKRGRTLKPHAPMKGKVQQRGKALEALKREAFRLRVVEKRSVADVAAAFDRTTAAIYNWQRSPYWRKLLADYEKQDAEALQAVQDTFSEDLTARRSDMERYRAKLWTLAQKVGANALRVLDNGMKSKVTDNELNENGKVVKRIESDDAAAVFSMKMMTGRGFESLLNAAYAGVYVKGMDEGSRAGLANMTDEELEARIRTLSEAVVPCELPN